MKIAFGEITGIQAARFGHNHPVQIGVAGLESMPKTAVADWRVDLLPFGRATSHKMLDTYSPRPVAKFLVPRRFSPQALTRDTFHLLDDMSGSGKGTSARIDLTDNLVASIFGSEVQDGLRGVIGGIKLFAGRPLVDARVEQISQVLIAMGPKTLEAFGLTGGLDAVFPRAVAHIPLTSILT